jgi:hypothetical protein
MTIVSSTGSRTTTTANTFWVAANIMFDLGTGEKKEILLMVNKVEDATVFTEQDAQRYFQFVAARASNIGWSVERLTTSHNLQRLGRFVIKGVQNV